ncbi:hypothetical protein DPM19_26180 [Actinomadura craniellae]|uniref:RING-type domain-containing protein n=1 Tax=Actinomadura craniellae TaxID=2231787 RepID=A0A365GZG5_9ACTN|nr:hypothetical protein [Actinomadura craniellae]RAY12211.1 hypothetical protein DPM19_26180 [Actinomadura craniellae]
MSCDHLICARCSGPVIEARCPTCRNAREEMHRHGSGLSPAVVLAALVLLFALTLALALHQTA